MSSYSKQTDRQTSVILIVILILQIFMSIYWGSQKEGYHIDEIYTCTLSNYEPGFIAWTENARNEWKTGDFYNEIINITDKECFNFSMVYQNQEKDVHPPLYYYVIHTLSSIFGSFSKWVGIATNIVWCFLTSIVMFYISKKMFDKDILALLCTGVWALSIGTMTSVVFIRMYAMLTFFASALVGLHLKAFEELNSENKLSKKTLMVLFICTTLGILTQYYYLIFCFFLCGFFALHLLINKKWKTILEYCLVQFGAVFSSIFYFPAMIKHIFYGYRGEQAFNEFLNGETGNLEKIGEVLDIISKDLFNGYLVGLIFILIVVGCLLILKFVKEKKKTELLLISGFANNRLYYYLLLLTICIGYVVIVVKVAPYQTDRYYMCIYPIMIVLIVKITNAVFRLIIGKKATIVSIIMFTLLVIASYINQDVDYLYKIQGERQEILLDYKGANIIVLNGLYDSATDQWLFEYGNYYNVFVCEGNGDLTGLEKAVNNKDLSEGFLLYAHAMNESSEELFEKIEKYINIESYELITDKVTRVFFCTLE